MAVTTINESERTRTYEDGSFMQWTDGADAVKLAIVSAWNFTPSMDDFDIDRIDSAKPIFTPITDKRGTFSVNLKNAISLYETTATPIDEILLSKWFLDIQEGEPPEIIFAPVIKAGSTNGSFPTNPFVNFIYTGRIMNIPIDQILDQGVQDVEISGDIILITQARREATANNEG